MYEVVDQCKAAAGSTKLEVMCNVGVPDKCCRFGEARVSTVIRDGDAVLSKIYRAACVLRRKDKKEGCKGPLRPTGAATLE
jgi:hypothetical protein